MLVLMMLFLLFMLGVAFFFSAWTHAFMARNYLNMKRAYVVAEGGVHTAMGAIIGDFAWAMHAQNKPVDFRWRYGDDAATPVEYALNPSYSMGRTLRILDREVGLSGVMDPGGGAYGINSDIYHLKVNECSAQLYVNEGLGHPYNTAVMRRILNNLGDQLGIAELGTRIMQNRPPEGYKIKTELKKVLGDQYDIVKDFLCVHTWSDPKVVNPVPLNEYNPQAKAAYQPELFATPTRGIRGNARATRFCDDGQPSDDVIIYSQKELIPTRIEVTRRAPVNINTTAREILVSLLQDLEGFFVMDQLRGATGNIFQHQVSAINHIFSYPAHGKGFGIGQDVVGDIGVAFRTPPISRELAEILAGLIIKLRPFKTSRQLEDFLDRYVWHFDRNILEYGAGKEAQQVAEELNIVDASDYTGPFSYHLYHRLFWDHYKYLASQAIADVIKANFNPNLHLNELNPDADLWGWVDKTDLITNSAEFCFLPTGYFEIESVGQILRAEWEDGKFHISPYLLIMKDSFEHNNQIMGQRRLRVEVKLWDLYRQTSQSDFYRGNFSRNSSPLETSGNWGCETGPGLNNAHSPFGNNYEGYVALATMGGSLPLDKIRIKGKLYHGSQQLQDHFIQDHFDFNTNRRDGFYGDRDTIKVYDIGDTIPDQGTFSYWIKPGFLPELNSYTRSVSCIPATKVFGDIAINHLDHQIGYGFAGEEPLGYRAYPVSSMRARLAALLVIGKTILPQTYFHALTCTLNHLHHECGNGPWGWRRPVWYQHGPWKYAESPFMAHRWIHVAIVWQYKGWEVDHGLPWNPWDDRFGALGECQVWVNNRLVSEQLDEIVIGAAKPIGLNYKFLGPRRFVLGGDGFFSRPSHCTIDEFYFLGGRVNPARGPCWCEEERVCKGGPGASCKCYATAKCKGGEGIPCPCTKGWYTKYYDCSKKPCPCPSIYTCKGGKGKPCYCPGWGKYKRKCKGGKKPCYSFCKCGGDGVFDCYSYYCKCDGTGEIYKCTFFCKCDGDKKIEQCSKNCTCGGDGLIDDCERRRVKKRFYYDCKCDKGEVILGIGPAELSKQQWRNGRYYRYNDAEFTSHQIDLAGGLPYLLAEPNPVTDPYGRPRWTGAKGVSEEVSKERWGKATGSGIRILGMAWTYRGWVQDYQGIQYGHDPVLLAPQLEVSLYKIDADGERLIAGPFLNLDSGWAPIMYQLPKDGLARFRYRVRFNTRCDPLNSILLESPILDDVTIYYATRPVFLSWQEGY
jgi:hypothetical protein